MQSSRHTPCAVCLFYLNRGWTLIKGFSAHINCTATGNSGHSLRQDCGIIFIYLKGVSDGEPNENEEPSLPSLKAKLFLRLLAVTVPKQKCAEDITSAMNSFQSGSDNLLIMWQLSLKPLIKSLMPLWSGSPNLNNSLGG